MLENTPNQRTKFRTKNWVDINDDSCGTCNTSSRNLFDYLPKVEIKDYNVMIDGKNFFD